MKFGQDEFKALDLLIENLPSVVEHQVLDEVNYKNETYPIHAFSIGKKSPDIPVFGIFGGVHGLEQVGSHVVLSYLNYLFQLLSWDENTVRLFERVRLVSIPIINPVGIVHLMRSNGNGVDLMRNSPIDSYEKVVPLVGGHRLGKLIPWYRGKRNEMELESRVLCDFVKEHVLSADNSITIDFHSGFGFKDRLWYPYACSTKPFDRKPMIDKLEKLFDKTVPHHIYKIEPQSDNYTTHGDLWDYLYFYRKEKFPEKNFIPLTLEMGSWIWLKKNPLQLFSKGGLFNPIKNHRFDRAMRRHFLMIDFFLRASANPNLWNKMDSNPVT